MNNFFYIICIFLLIFLLNYKKNNNLTGGNVNKVVDLRCQPYIKKKYISPWLNSFMEYDTRSKCLQ